MTSTDANNRATDIYHESKGREAAQGYEGIREENLIQLRALEVIGKLNKI